MTILTSLREAGEMHIDNLAIAMNMSVRELSILLFDLEMSGKVKVLPGNTYKLA